MFVFKVALLSNLSPETGAQTGLEEFPCRGEPEKEPGRDSREPAFVF